ncbi:hypothetical protein [Rhizohabitans arisaemae]|nr:hypothetical protein [Rhizohabitans arisaemae]
MTIEDAAALLHPLFTFTEGREIIDLLGLEPYGACFTGRPGVPRRPTI